MVVWQWTWGMPQTLIGFIASRVIPADRRRRFRSATVCAIYQREAQWDWGLSLGLYIIVTTTSRSNLNLVRRMYGHSLQSAILGPLYLPVIGISTLIIAAQKLMTRKPNRALMFAEVWADELGGARRVLSR